MPQPPLPHMQIFALDPEKIGDALARLVAVSAMLGHAEVRNTLCYTHGVPSGTEADFVLDVLRLSNGEIADKWFGGDYGIQKYAEVVRGPLEQVILGAIKPAR